MKTEHLLLLGLGVLLFMLLRRQPAALQQGQRVQNAETWEWVDAEGNKRSMTVHRDVQST